MSLRVLILRHGQIKANKEGRWHGSTDSALTWKGRRQAKRTGRFLAKHLAGSLSAVYASPLQRCRNTASFATRTWWPGEIQVHDGLAEMGIGEWENMPFTDLAKEHNFVGRSTQDPDFCAPGGESLNQVAKRTLEAFSQIRAHHTGNNSDETPSPQTVMLVSHGVAMSVLLASLLYDDATKWNEFRLGNCSLTELQVDDVILLKELNQTFHL